MRDGTYFVTVGVVFSLIAIGHLARVTLGATLVVDGAAIPMWPSIVVVVLMGYLAFEGFRKVGKPR